MTRPPGADPTPETSATGRRGFLRRALATAAVGGLVTTAGCASELRPAARTVDASVVGSDVESLSAAEFEQYADRMRDRYGESGVWGIAGEPADDDLSYVGAWTKQVRLADGEDGAPLAAADNALALFEIPDKIDEDGNQYFAAWLWSAARPAEPSDDGPFRATPVLRALGAGASLTRGSQDVLAYSPSRTFETSPVAVARPSPFDESDPATFPLQQGTVAVVPAETRVGGAGSYAVEWTGKYDGVQSVNAVFETRWQPDESYSFEWDVSVEAGRSGLV